jgi:hypothetical protein
MGHHRTDGRLPSCDSWQLQLNPQGLQVKLLVLEGLLLVTTAQHINIYIGKDAIGKDLCFALDNFKILFNLKTISLKKTKRSSIDY